MKRSALLLIALCASGCAGTARLYPANDVAVANGVLTLAYTKGDHGAVSSMMPDGEDLMGEYTVVSGGSASFGTIIGSLTASQPGSFQMTGSLSANSFALTTSADGRGVADLVGTHGTSMQCEFLTNNFSGHGYGACRTSKGALYRLQY